MYVALSILIFLASLLMIGVVLIQKSKGGGLATNVNSYNQFMGVRKTTDFIEKATWTLAIVILVFSITSAFVAPRLVQGNKPQVTSNPMQQSRQTPFSTDGEQQGTNGTQQQAPAQK